MLIPELNFPVEFKDNNKYLKLKGLSLNFNSIITYNIKEYNIINNVLTINKTFIKLEPL